MTDIHVIIWLGAGIGAAVMAGVYYLERHVRLTHQIRMPRPVRVAFYGMVLIFLFPLIVMPLYYPCPVAARMGVGSALSCHPLMSERLLEAAHRHHQDLKREAEEARDNRVMRRV